MQAGLQVWWAPRLAEASEQGNVASNSCHLQEKMFILLAFEINIKGMFLPKTVLC